jgi:hypothetical protein
VPAEILLKKGRIEASGDRKTGNNWEKITLILSRSLAIQAVPCGWNFFLFPSVIELRGGSSPNRCFACALMRKVFFFRIVSCQQI